MWGKIYSGVSSPDYGIWGGDSSYIVSISWGKFQISMKDLLTRIKNRLLQYNNDTLSDVITYKRGILPPIPAYPAIAILPEEEVIRYMFTGGLYRSDKSVSIEIYVKSASREYARNKSSELLDAVRDIIQSDIYLNRYVKDTAISDEVYGIDVTMGSTFIYASSMKLKCSTRESFPSSRTIEYNVSNSTISNFVDTVVNIFKAKSALSSIQMWIKWSTGNIGRFPAIEFNVGSISRDRSFLGAEDVTIPLEINLYCKAGAKEQLLNRALDYSETIKEVIHENPTWNGICYKSSISSITYDIYSDINHFLYGVKFLVLCKFKDVVDQSN